MAILTLFKSIEQIQDYISVDISGDIKTVLPYIKQAEKFTTEIIGYDLHASLLDLVQNDGNDAKLTALLPYVQLPLINFAYMLGIYKLAVTIGDSGISTVETGNLTPADKSLIKELKTSLAASGYDGLEFLLEFLENNVDDYPTWKSSSAYSYNKKFFVNNAKEMNDAIFIGITRYDFLKLKPFIHQVERSAVLPTMCSGLFNLIKAEILDGNVSDNNKLLLNTFIQPAVCYLALDKHKQDENFKQEGIKYIEQMQEYLNENAETYTVYQESDCYEDPEEAVEINDEDSGLFVMGG